MSNFWLYQLSALDDDYAPRHYRADVWEGRDEAWGVNGYRKNTEITPEAGDVVVFFYCQTGCDDAGFYGWAVITAYTDGVMYFRPVFPSDYLKVSPWWTSTAKELADRIRGKVKHQTLFLIDPKFLPKLRAGLGG